MSTGHDHDSGGPPWMNRLLLILTISLVVLIGAAALCARRQP